MSFFEAVRAVATPRALAGSFKSSLGRHGVAIIKAGRAIEGSSTAIVALEGRVCDGAEEQEGVA
jgi:hypothetical protein